MGRKISMKKLLTIGATFLAGLTLAACSSSSSSQSSNSSSESSTSNNAKQASSQQKKPLVSKKVSGNDNSSSSKSTKAANVSDPKIIGLLAYQDVFGKGSITDLYFGSNSGDNNNGNNGQYLIGAGSTGGTISFSINGDTVTIYKMDGSGTTDAEARYTSYDVSLKELEDKYYNTTTDQQNIQKAAQNLKDANSSSDDSDQDSSSDNDDSSDQTNDDDDNNSADQPSDDQNVDTNDDVDE